MKYIYSIALLLFATTCSAFTLPSKHIYTEIVINAPVEKVWSVLVNNKEYPKWNPYHVKVEGSLKQGNELFVEINKPNGEVVKIHPHVMVMEPNKELTWGGGIKGIFYGKHEFILEEIGRTQTRLIQKEKFSGLAIPFASLEAIDEGYSLMNKALKQKLEED